MHDFCENYSKSKNSKKKKHARASYNPPQSTESQKKKSKKESRIGPKRPPTAYNLYF